jgi:indolepyruvate ferredoxin oxidoreductase beta subunit
MDNTTNIALVGVGGQGILLASEVVSLVGVLAGLDVKKNEVHGMAQRGGSVVSQVRIGRTVHSPLIPDGEVDFLVSFELIESLRHADSLAPGGMALINKQLIVPVTVSSGQQPMVTDVDERIARAFPERRVLDALAIARELGNTRTVNMVMAGALSRLMPFEPALWERAISDTVPERHRDVNLRAFTAGRSATSG